jgi:GT2 family glycosyltransferase
MKETTVQQKRLTRPAPRVGVIIVTWNKKDFVLNLLDDLAARPYPNWTVRVIDNHSSDGTVDAIRQRHPWVIILPMKENLGGTGGFNAGLRAVLQEDGLDYVWLLDNDVSLEPGALEVLVETLEARPDAGVAGSHMIQMDSDGITNEIGGDVDLAHGRLVLHHHGSYARLHRQEVYDCDYVAACSLLVRFEVLRNVGLWDDFFIHYDDVDWCLRIRTAGYRVLACAASRIRHMSARAKPVTWILYYDIRNMLYLQRKHMEFRPLRELAFLAMLMYFNMRDELAGKRYYAQLIEQAVRDFVTGRMGKGTGLPKLELEPAKEALSRILQGPPGSILVLEPTRRPVFGEDDFEAATRNGFHLAAVCHENEQDHTALPDGAQRVRLSGNRWIMAAQLIKRILFRRRVDVLILDIDKPCGLLSLCARRILLLSDNQCHDVRGGSIRLLAALAQPFRWIPILLRWVANSPPLAGLRASAHCIYHALRHMPACLFPHLALKRRLRLWPLLPRIRLAQAALGDNADARPPARTDGRNGPPCPAFRASTAGELHAALQDAARLGGDVLVTAARIELDQGIRIPSGVNLTGPDGTATLVFRNVKFGIMIAGEPDHPVRNSSISKLVICHESSPAGFSAAILIAQARDITLDNVQVSAPCGIGIVATDDAQRVALSNCTVHAAGQDGLLLLRRVLDFSATACSFQDNRQSGILLCDWPLPPGCGALDFGAQLRHPACHAIAFEPADPAPCRILLRDCEIARNRKMGVCTDGAGLLTIEGCRIYENQCEGVTLDNGTWHARVTRCDIQGNGRRARQMEDELSVDFVAGDDCLPDGSSAVKLPGVSMDNAAFCRVEACSIRDNYGEGVKLVRAAYRCEIRGNAIADNNRGRSPGHPHHGIRLGADIAQHPGQHDFPGSSNAILDNHISGPHEHGILLNAGTILNRMAGNRIEGTRSSPIRNWSRRANHLEPDAS